MNTDARLYKIENYVKATAVVVTMVWFFVSLIAAI